MASETGNAQTKKENRGSDSPNIELQKQEPPDAHHSDARDETGRKGGGNAKDL